jgi:NAD-reducing hydrogenase small subunit
MSAPKLKLATIWLDGCSGCHMSLLDMDERLLDLAPRIEMVWSPLVDAKAFPDVIDLTLLEGAVATDEDIEKVRALRKRSKFMLALGDCAVTGNVPSMRNGFKLTDVFDRAYVENSTIQKQHPATSLPVLEKHARPVHEVVKVDVHVPGCPPPADAIFYVISELLEGRMPEPTKVTRFGR